jgi:hypothetical protein
MRTLGIPTAAGATGPSGRGATTALTISTGHAAVDASVTDSWTLNANATVQIDNPSNLVAGMDVQVAVTRDGTHAVTFGNAYKFPDGVTPVGNNTNGKIDVYTGKSFDGTNVLMTYIGSF